MSQPQPLRRRTKILFGCVAFVILCPIIGLTVITSTSLGLCLDFVSGHVPSVARERFMEQVARALLHKDYDWLESVGSEETLQQVKRLPDINVNHYAVIPVDDLAGTYDYRIRFERGPTLYVTFLSIWPECPDFDVTEQEILQNIQLHSVFVVSDR